VRTAGHHLVKGYGLREAVGHRLGRTAVPFDLVFSPGFGLRGPEPGHWQVTGAATAGRHDLATARIRRHEARGGLAQQ
jgi:hypothetical protein